MKYSFHPYSSFTALIYQKQKFIPNIYALIHCTKLHIYTYLVYYLRGSQFSIASYMTKHFLLTM